MSLQCTDSRIGFGGSQLKPVASIEDQHCSVWKPLDPAQAAGDLSCRPGPTVDSWELRVVDDFVAELHGVLSDLDPGTPAPPEDTGVLAEIDQTIRPARLPSGARRLWELIEPGSLQQIVGFYPLLARPDFALWMWREHENTGIVPRHFFPLCYESHDVMSIECDGPDWTGGSLFEWFLSDPGSRFTLTYRGVENWLMTLIAALRNGDYRRVSDHHVMIESEPVRQLARERLTHSPADPVYGTAYEFDAVTVPAKWPAVWHERSSR